MTPKMLSIGIDWAEYRHAVAIYVGPDQLLDVFEIEDTITGYHQLLDAAHTLQQRFHADRVAFLIECRNHRLVDFLLAQGFVGFYLDPNRTAGYRLRYKVSGAKSDPDDARMFGDILARDQDRLPPIVPAAAIDQKLQALLMDRDKFIQERTRLTHRLTDALHEYYPEARQLFGDVVSPTALAFLAAYPTRDQARQLPESEVRQFLKQQHSYQERRVKRIMKVLSQPAIPVPAPVVETRQLLVEQLIPMLQAAQNAIAAYDERIATRSKGNADVELFRSLPGAGVILAATLKVLFGEDRTRFSSAQEVQSYIGTSPRTVMSGQYRSVQFRFGCNHFFRGQMDTLAWCATRRSDWARNYYQRKRREGKSHHTALRIVGNSQVGIAFAMWKSGKKYDEAYHLASIQRYQMRNEPKLMRALT